jgi:hypothetical protein
MFLNLSPTWSHLTYTICATTESDNVYFVFQKSWKNEGKKAELDFPFAVKLTMLQFLKLHITVQSTVSEFILLKWNTRVADVQMRLAPKWRGNG